MASARPPSGGTPTARIGVDLTALRAAPAVARQAAQATAREIQNAFRLNLETARQTTTVLRAQQQQITAVTRAESQARISFVRAEAQAKQQLARVEAAARIEQERRITAQFKSELRERERAQRQSQASMGGIGRGVASFAGAALGGPIGGLAGALAGGAPALAAGLAFSEGARAAVESAQIATAYNRQRVAAISLAGSQAKLNELLTAYQRAAGGAVDKATALAETTRLQAVGFADDAEEVERFTRAVRGSAIAMGKLQDDISQEVQLAISNQSLRRLDQIGLGITEVNNRIEELRTNNAGMTREAAFQEAVLGLLIEKFGALTTSAEGQATGVERVTATWRDLRLEMSRELQPNVDRAANDLANLFDWINRVRVANAQFQREAQGSRAQQEGAVGPQFLDPVPSWMTRATPFAGPRRAPDRFNADQIAALRRRDEGFAEIERRSSEARLEARRTYEQQYSQIVSNFEKQRGREAEDFARARLYAERKFNLSLLDVAQDSARQRARWEEDLAHSLEERRQERDERIAEARQESNERLRELEERFNKDREKRQRDYAKRIREATAELDAVAVRELQRERREENKEAKEAHEERVADERKALHKRVDEANKSYEKEARQQRAALDRRIALQAEDDARRIEEMKAAFAEQQAQEDTERAIRLARQAEDHQDQLIELAKAHADRVEQIKTHAQREREQFTEESNRFLEEVSVHNEKWLKEERRRNDEVLRLHTELLEAQRQALLVPGHPSLGDPYAGRDLPQGARVPMVTPSGGNRNVISSSRTVTVHPGAIQVIAAPGMNEQAVGDLVLQRMAQFLEDYANQ